MEPKVFNACKGDSSSERARSEDTLKYNLGDDGFCKRTLTPDPLHGYIKFEIKE